jgi:hypothetical protein
MTCAVVAGEDRRALSKNKFDEGPCIFPDLEPDTVSAQKASAAPPTLLTEILRAYRLTVAACFLMDSASLGPFFTHGSGSAFDTTVALEFITTRRASLVSGNICPQRQGGER